MASSFSGGPMPSMNLLFGNTILRRSSRSKKHGMHSVREVQEQSLALAQVRWLAVSQFPQSHRVAVRSKMAFTERI